MTDNEIVKETTIVLEPIHINKQTISVEGGGGVLEQPYSCINCFQLQT